ncbi:hypothetical protein ACO0RG_003437 [Hanseniaspora osmophila]|uniref:Uncharacterized protein n=1 Tax=Hanseniaspora osmophila TaxID=56408 RepID=A0A1E5REI5_9ASCO|nr:hypothetical protein AWRI3579_g2079 [Hanseniaspora osmophila]
MSDSTASQNLENKARNPATHMPSQQAEDDSIKDHHTSSNMNDSPAKEKLKIFSKGGKEIPAHRLKYPHNVKPNGLKNTGILQTGGHRPTLEDTREKQ